jgi:hypothetical protein
MGAMMGLGMMMGGGGGGGGGSPAPASEPFDYGSDDDSGFTFGGDTEYSFANPGGEENSNFLSSVSGVDGLNPLADADTVPIADYSKKNRRLFDSDAW